MKLLKKELLSRIKNLSECDTYEGFFDDAAWEILKKARVRACDFIKSLPDIKLPEHTSVLADGSVNIEWYSDKNKVLNLNFEDDDLCSYSYIYDEESGCSDFVFKDGVIPDEVINLIKRYDRARSND